MLLASVKGAPVAEAAQAAATPDGPSGSADPGTSTAATGTATAVLDRPEEPTEEPPEGPAGEPTDEATQAEPEPGDVTQTEDTVSDPQDVGPDAAAAEEPDPEVEAAEPETTEPEAGPAGNGTKPRAAEPTPEDNQGKLRAAPDARGRHPQVGWRPLVLSGG